MLTKVKLHNMQITNYVAVASKLSFLLFYLRIVQ